MTSFMENVSRNSKKLKSLCELDFGNFCELTVF